MITLDEARAHIGAGVVYRPPGWAGSTPVDGVITSVNDRYVFVKYTGDHPSAAGKATYPADLTLLADSPPAPPRELWDDDGSVPREQIEAMLERHLVAVTQAIGFGGTSLSTICTITGWPTWLVQRIARDMGKGPVTG